MKVNYKQIVFIMKNLSVYLKSGIPISNALLDIEGEIKNKKYKASIKNVRNSISEGLTLYQAFNKEKSVFPDMMLIMINVGDITGNMDNVLLKVSDYYDKLQKEHEKRINSMSYPMIIGVMLILFLFVFTVFLYPDMYNSFRNEGDTSSLASYILAFSSFVRNNTISFVLILLSALIIIKLILKCSIVNVLKISLEKRSKLHNIKKELSFVRIMYMMIYSGVPVSTFLQIYLNSDILEEEKKEIKAFYSSLQKGNSISVAMKKTLNFSNLTISLIEIGEKTGALEEKLQNLCEVLEEKYYRKMNMMSNLLEPCSFIVLGIMILFIFLLIYNTIYGGMMIT